MSRHSAGLAPATRVASRKLGPVAAAARPRGRRAAWATRTLATTCGRCDDGGHHPVVGVGVDRGGLRAEAGRRSRCRRSSSDARRRRRRRQVPGGAVEEVLAGVRDAGRLAPASGWPPTKRSSPSAATTRALGRADVGDDGSRRGACARTAATVVGQRAERDGDERGVGAVERVAEVVVGLVDRPAPRAASAARGSIPRTVAPSLRRAASPTDPPITPDADDRDDQAAAAASTKAILPATAAAASTLRAYAPKPSVRSAAARRRWPPRAAGAPRR